MGHNGFKGGSDPTIGRDVGSIADEGTMMMDVSGQITGLRTLLLSTTDVEDGSSFVLMDDEATECGIRTVVGGGLGGVVVDGEQQIVEEGGNLFLLIIEDEAWGIPLSGGVKPCWEAQISL